MTTREMAQLVHIYFTVESDADVELIRMQLADAVEEAGVDPKPLREPGHLVIVVPTYEDLVDDESPADRLHYHTFAERKAYVQGSVDADELALVNTIFFREAEYARNYPDRPDTVDG